MTKINIKIPQCPEHIKYMGQSFGNFAELKKASGLTAGMINRLIEKGAITFEK
jgi:hypothetical protein